MPNIIQRIIYNLSSLAPLFVLSSILSYIEGYYSKLSIFAFILGVVLIILFYISFSYAKEKIEPVMVSANSIEPNDNKAWIYIISYLIPFGTAVVDINMWKLVGGSCFLIIVLPFINFNMFNPILCFMGYKFYKVNLTTGISGYILVSKRNLRGSDHLRYAKRIFEFLLLDNEKD